MHKAPDSGGGLKVVVGREPYPNFGEANSQTPTRNKSLEQRIFHIKAFY